MCEPDDGGRVLYGSIRAHRHMSCTRTIDDFVVIVALVVNGTIFFALLFCQIYLLVRGITATTKHG